ncbi:hypothetical protein FOZ60_003343 [Perkinsus olseni]|uniref:Uncharacterized protein n=2 Tax=Perkinsus olseni TaxID=32597 RepID=A0A7J6PHT7_PEROL|nr:hypothetical protein FOZ60_003343 [Perkinsus olseni]
MFFDDGSKLLRATNHDGIELPSLGMRALRSTVTLQRRSGLLFRLPFVARYSVVYACTKGVNYAMFFWLPYYLSEVCKLDPGLADGLSVFYDIGQCLGGVIAGSIVDKWARGKKSIVITSFLVFGHYPNSSAQFEVWIGGTNHNDNILSWLAGMLLIRRREDDSAAVNHDEGEGIDIRALKAFGIGSSYASLPLLGPEGLSDRLGKARPTLKGNTVVNQLLGGVPQTSRGLLGKKNLLFTLSLTELNGLQDLQRLQLRDYGSIDAAGVQVRKMIQHPLPTLPNDAQYPICEVGGPANLISAAVCADLGSQADAESNVTASVSGLVDGVASIGAAMTQLAIPVLTTGSSWAWLFVAFTGMLLMAAFLLVPVMRKEMADQSREEGVSLTQMSE